MSFTYAQKPKLLSETYYFEDKNFKKILFDSLGRRTLTWQQKVKKLPSETYDEVSFTEYSNDNLNSIQKIFHGRVSKKGLLYFPPPKIPCGILIFWHFDTLQKRYENELKYFRFGKNYTPMPLNKAWVEPINIYYSDRFGGYLRELIDSTRFQSTYCIFNENSEGEEVRVYNEDQKLISLTKNLTYQYGSKSQSTTLYYGDFERKIACYQGYSKKDYCNVIDLYDEEGTIVKIVYYHNIDGKEVNELDLKQNYVIEYLFPHPTIEKQIVKTRRKVFEITVRKKYW